MGERETISFRIRGEKKTRWQSAVEENVEYDSLSHLIRKAVAHELSDAYGKQSTSENFDTGGIESSLDHVEGTLEELERTVRSVESSVMESRSVTSDTLTSVMNALPDDVYREGKTISEVAEETGRDEAVVGAALTQLEKQTGTVRSSVDDDGTRRWKGGERE